MSPIVMKFGGTSVADADHIKNVARRVVDKKNEGNRVVVVVSAPGKMTDDLESLAEGITQNPDPREMDMLLATGEQVSIALLSMAIKDLGEDSISLTGAQAGIFADLVHTRARITKIRPTKLLKELSNGRIVIVAGFQGLNPNRDVVTLGRGGSDLTAVALAAVLRSSQCEIYTDVKGIYTADPRVVPDAQKIPMISYDEMLELAGAGAQVMQARSVEVGKKFNVPIHVRSSISEEKGTLITREATSMEEAVVSGIALDRNQAKLSILDVPDRPGIAARIFGDLAQQSINVDMIIQSAANNRANDISFTVTRTDLSRACRILERIRQELGAKSIVSDDTVAKISVVGVGMRSHPGVAATMFSVLAKQNINIEMISTSEIKIACVISESSVDRAVRVLHQEYGLSRSRVESPKNSRSSHRRTELIGAGKSRRK